MEEHNNLSDNAIFESAFGETKTIKSVITFLSYIKKIQLSNAENPCELLFRGHSNTSYPLLPSIGRSKNRNLLYDLNQEETIFLKFKSVFHLYADDRPLSDIDLLFLAQHYGLPTKVLDWTYDYKVGLYFALTDIIDSEKEDSDGVLWAFNYKLFENNPFENEMFFNRLHFYRPEYDNNPNLRAQRGLFSFIIDDVHNQNKQSLEDIIINELKSKKEYNQEEWSDFKDPRVLPPQIKIDKPIFYKFIIKKDKKPEMLKELYSEGYSEEYLFPGFDGVKKAMRNSVILEEKLK